MRIKTLSIGLLLFIVLAVNPVTNEVVSVETGSSVINAALPGLQSFISILKASPAGPYLIAGLGLLHVLSMIIMGAASEANDALTKNDLANTKKELMNKLNDIDAHISESTSKIINELGLKIESHATIRQMRLDLESLNLTTTNKMPYILDSNKPPRTTEIIDNLLDEEKTFRVILKSFITKYIEPSLVLPAIGHEDLVFEFIIRENDILAEENEDCTQDSHHNKIFKSYIYITKILTDAYDMVLSAHIVRYQEQLSQSKAIEAAQTKTDAEAILQSFKDDMKALMEKTQWALEHSLREIKNCGSFKLIEGENYVRLPFVTTIPVIKEKGLLSGCYNALDQPIRHYYFKSFFPCRIAKEKIPTETYLEAYYNTSDLNRPYSYVKTYDGNTFGHADGPSSSHLTKITTGWCDQEFYHAYRKTPVRISTQRISANAGMVITGVRFRVESNVLYIDIQQGKFISDFEVDPNTPLRWKKSPEDFHRASEFVRNTGIEIADYELREGKNLTAIQLVGDGFNELFRLYLNSESHPFTGRTLGSEEIHEIKLDDRDDPARTEDGAKRLISKRRDPDFAYIKFQTTSFEKDLGRTTIPYIDTREVVTNPPSPVIGIGIYHSAAKGDGGLLSLKLIQRKMTEYVDYSKLEQLASPEVVP